jgi:hypothetical protein
MKHIACIFAALVLSILPGGCSHSARASHAPAPSSDPFAGFFAHPGFGKLELKGPDAGGKYQGTMWSDSGPFPVELTRNGNSARGTVTYAGAPHSLSVQSTDQGLVLTADGTRAPEPLRRYKDMQSYKTWLATQGGYRATITGE